MNSIEQDDRPGLFIRSKSSILHEQVPRAGEVEARGSLPKTRQGAGLQINSQAFAWEKAPLWK